MSEKKRIIIWKESVYKLDFTCPRCGRQIFSIKKGLTHGAYENTFGRIICACGNIVGITEFMETDLEPGLYGKWPGKFELN